MATRFAAPRVKPSDASNPTRKLPMNARSIVTSIATAAAVVGTAAGCGGSGGGAGSTLFGASSGAGLSASAGPVNSSGSGWPALLHGPSHYGAATAAGPQTASIRWQRTLEGPVVPGPVVTAAGVGYVASGGGVLHAINISTGKDRWQFNGGGHFGANDLSTSPLVLADGRVIWPGPRHTLFGLSATGAQQWTIAAASDLVTPVLDPTGGELIVADEAGHISGYRLSPGSAAPKQLWTKPLAKTSFGSPVVAADGSVYQTAGNSLYALSPNGALKWTLATPKPVEVSPAVADGGVVVFGSDNLLEYGVTHDGKLRWRVPIGNFTYSSPLALASHRVIFGNHLGQMTTLDSTTGKLISRDNGQGQLWTSAAVDNRGDAYFASRTGYIYGFDATGKRLFSLKTATTYDSYPAIAPDGTLLIGGDSGVLYAIR